MVYETTVRLGSFKLPGFHSLSTEFSENVSGSPISTTKLLFEPSESLLDLELTSPITVTARQNEQEGVIFSGFVVRAGFGGRFYEIHAQDPQVVLNEKTAIPSFGRGFHVAEAIDILLRYSGDWPVDIPWERILGSHNFGKPRSRLSFYIPLNDFKTPPDRVQIAGATLIDSSDQECRPFALADSYAEFSSKAVWAEGKALAILALDSNDFVDALSEARRKTHIFCAAVSAAYDLRSSSDGGSIPDSFIDFDRSRLGTAVPEPAIGVLVDGMPRDLRFWVVGRYPDTRKKSIDIDAYSEARHLLASLAAVGAKSDARHARRVERSLLSLYGAKHSDLLVDKANHLSCAMEHLVSGRRAESQVDAATVTTMVAACMNSVSVEKRSEQLESRISSVLTLLTDESLMSKFQRHCQEIGVSVSPESLQALNKARKARNDWVHGDEARLSASEISVAYDFLHRVVARTIWDWAAS